MQLEAYIRSFNAALPEADLTVVHRDSSPEMKDAYSSLAEMFPDVKFVREANFRRHVARWLASGKTPLVMFGCDDVVFKGRADLSVIAAAFNTSERLFGFSLRLGKEITYSGMRRAPARRPVFIRETPYLLWNWRETGEADWAYPFELDCTIYSRAMVKEIIKVLDADSFSHPNWPGVKSGSWGHPNRLEGFGSVVAKNCLNYDLMASFPEAKGSVVTVNRVQDECANFVYGESDALSPAGMLDLWRRGYVMDMEKYAGKKHSSIHIGDIFIKHRESGEPFQTAPYDFHRVMIKDYEEVLRGAGNPVADHPAFAGFRDSFVKYFETPGAERDMPLMIKPSFAEDASSAAETVFKRGWLERHLAKLRPVSMTDIGSPGSVAGLASVAPPRVRLRRPDFKLSDIPAAVADSDVVTSFGFLSVFGLGSDGGCICPDGTVKMISELVKNMRPGSSLLGSLRIAKEPFICFNRGRALRREDILALLGGRTPAAESFASGGLAVDPSFINCLRDYESMIWLFHFVI
jgi:hypothetical protein